ncbi:hypothetical protein ACHAW6_007473 [Cyclotella cf. meneghiniana]
MRANIVPSNTSIVSSTEPTPQANSIYECENTNQLLNFYYATMGYPVVSTWFKAIDKGYFQGWNGLTSERVLCFVKPSASRSKASRHQIHQVIISHHNPRTHGRATRTATQCQTNMVFTTMVDIQGKMFKDQIGHFPITSNRGNNYVVIFYTVDANHIKSYPIKSHHRTELLRAYNDLYAYLLMQGYRPQLHKLDNESSHDVEAFITKNNATFQYTPPEIHPSNIAKRANRTWKTHFVAMRASAAKSYHLSNWCKYLEQTDNMILNKMHPSTQNPNLSLHEALEGMFSFNTTPMAHIVTECMIHIKPACGHTWSYHSIKAWYFALALNHYRCIKTVTDTGAVHLADIFNFLQHSLPTPTMSNADCITKAIRNLDNTIKGHPPTQTDDHLDADGYYQCCFTLGLWHHKWCPVPFSFVVEDDGIKTVGLIHAMHLKATLQKYFNVTID